MSGIEPHLPQLYPYLVEAMRHPKPLVKSIACWTLSRYSVWIINNSVEPYMVSLLHRLVDKNKRVQEASVSALATFIEEAEHNVIPYLEKILQVVSKVSTGCTMVNYGGLLVLDMHF